MRKVAAATLFTALILMLVACTKHGICVTAESCEINSASNVACEGRFEEVETSGDLLGAEKGRCEALGYKRCNSADCER